MNSPVEPKQVKVGDLIAALAFPHPVYEVSEIFHGVQRMNIRRVFPGGHFGPIYQLEEKDLVHYRLVILGDDDGAQ